MYKYLISDPPIYGLQLSKSPFFPLLFINKKLFPLHPLELCKKRRIKITGLKDVSCTLFR